MDDSIKNARYRRNLFVYEKWVKNIDGRILDIGCDKRYMRNLCRNEYIGIDIHGSPDIYLDLEKEKIPFPPDSFECVICLDVLEHLDNLHEVLEQIIKISNKYIILSFPNEIFWKRLANCTKSNEREWGFYPTNRHKWFLIYPQVKHFIHDICRKYKLQVLDESIDYGSERHIYLFNKMLDKTIGKIGPNMFKVGNYVFLKKITNFLL